jgi:cytochrome c biogenesis protein CcmG/thiol:disulfide interchange protein DsbE
MLAPPAPPPRRSPGLARLLPLILFAGFLALVLYGLQRPADRAIRSAMVGKPAPEFALPGLGGAPGLASADLRTGKPVMVNVMASWCLPCRVEAPRLERLKEQGVVIHAIAVRDDARGLGGFFRAYGNPFARIGMDADGRAQIAFGSAGVPETFIVDGRGVIRHQHVGEIREEHVAGLLAQYRKLATAS